MGGPASTVVLRHALTDAEVRELETRLSAFGRRSGETVRG